MSSEEGLSPGVVEINLSGGAMGGDLAPSLGVCKKNFDQQF